MSNAIKGLVLGAVLGIAAVGLTTPANAAVIKSLTCDSHASRFSCVVNFEYTGLVTFAWYVDGKYQPLWPENYIIGSCPGGTSRDVKVVIRDDAGSATMHRGLRCITGNP